MATCGVAPLSRRSLELLLRNTWVGVLGDSVARLLCAALLRAVGDIGAAQPVLDGHRSFQYPLAAPGGRVDFVWAPYAENVTAALQGWRQQGQVPDVLILGVSLWHMLHVHDVSAYAASLSGVRAELDAIAGEGRNARVAMFWMSTTALITPKLLTDEKRARLTAGQIDAYNTAAWAALSLPAGPPCQLLDVHRLTAGAPPCAAHVLGPSCDPTHSARSPACGASCSEDGMHFHNATYDALLQQWGSALRFRRRELVCSRARSSRVAAAVNATLVERLCGARRGGQA